MPFYYVRKVKFLHSILYSLSSLNTRPNYTDYFQVINNVNCFGRESLNHISDAKYQELLRDPETSVAKVVALQRIRLVKRYVKKLKIDVPYVVIKFKYHPEKDLMEYVEESLSD